MEATESRCQTCTYFSRFFRSGAFGFWEEREGKCLKSGEYTQCGCTCEYWRKTKSEQKLTLQEIDIAIENVNVIAKLL